MNRLAIILLALLANLPAAASPDPSLFSWQQHRGAQLSPAIALRNAQGRPVTLASLLGATPLILDLDYYHCPSLCGVVRADLMHAMQTSGLTPGRDFAVLSLSIDPAETPSDAARAKATDLGPFPAMPSTAIHYLTAPAASIAAIASAVGFRARWDPLYKQFLHPAGIVVLTKSGQVSAYLLGVGYTGGDLRAALLRAGDGGIAEAALPVLLLCFHFDSTTGHYTLEVIKLLRLLGVLTLLVIGGLLLVLTRGRKSWSG